MEERPDPRPGPGQICVRVEACGVCRTDLHVVDGELPDIMPPIVPGHEIVGRIEAAGEGVSLPLGARVGVAWLGHACGHCPYCLSAHENLCDEPVFTGYTRDGGFATHTIADAAFSFPLDDGLDPVATAPLLCAGLIGWRSLKAAGEARSDRPLRLRRGGPHHCAGLPLAGAAGFRLHPTRRCGSAALRALPGGRMGRRVGRDAARFARRGDPVRARGRARAPGARRGAQRRTGRLRRHPYERHPLFSLSAPVGGAQRRIGRQSDPRRRRGVPGQSRLAPACERQRRAIRSTRPTRRSTTCARGALKGPRYLVP